MVITITNYTPFSWDFQTDNNSIQILKELREFVKKWIFIRPNRALENPRGDGSNTLQFIGKQAHEARNKLGRLLAVIFKLTNTEDLNINSTNSTILVSDIPGEPIKLMYFGSGFEQILLLLTSIYEEYYDNTVFFIEEPEIHLHAALQRKLLRYFIKRAINNQFFLTTHSTVFCRQLAGIVQPYIAKKMDYQTQFEAIGEDAMEEIKLVLGHANTDLFAYNAVLFVEGETEEKNIPLLAKNNDIDIVDQGVRILNSRGYGNMKQLENI
jgi:predicted ATP-dependent endonuclease of OLD family